MTAQGSTAPQLSALAIGGLTLSPTFDAGTYEYTTTTTNATNTITATAAAGTSVIVLVNGSSITNGTAATWAEGENTVRIQIANASGYNNYIVTVTKE